MNHLLQKMLDGELHHDEFTQHYPSSYMFMSNFEERQEFTKYSWAIITIEYIQSLISLTKGKKVLEVCAGHGLVTKLMNKQEGCEWIATDKKGENEYGIIMTDHVIKIEAMEAVIHFQPDILFVSWIPYTSILDSELADLEVPMIMVGESSGGCTGSNLIWDKKQIDYECNMAKIYPDLQDVPQWSGIHDRTWLINWKR